MSEDEGQPRPVAGHPLPLTTSGVLRQEVM